MPGKLVRIIIKPFSNYFCNSPPLQASAFEISGEYEEPPQSDPLRRINQGGHRVLKIILILSSPLALLFF